MITNDLFTDKEESNGLFNHTPVFENKLQIITIYFKNIIKWIEIFDC